MTVGIWNEKCKQDRSPVQKFKSFDLLLKAISYAFPNCPPRSLGGFSCVLLEYCMTTDIIYYYITKFKKLSLPKDLAWVSTRGTNPFKPLDALEEGNLLYVSIASSTEFWRTFLVS